MLGQFIGPKKSYRTASLLGRGRRDDRRDGLRGGRVDGGSRAPVGRVAAAALLVVVRIGRVLKERKV